MKIRIENKEGEAVFEGDYEYIETGFEKNGKPSFHITAHTPDFIEEYEIYFYCQNKEEVEELVNHLKEGIINKNLK